MKKSLLLLLFLVIAFLVVDRVVYLLLQNAEKSIYEGDTVGKVNAFEKAKDSVDILIFGSSRAVHHVDPKVFEPATFNAGVDATKLGYATALISTLTREEQTVLVHVDHEFFYDHSYEGTDALGLLNKTFSSRPIKEFFMEYFPSEVWMARISRCYAYNGKVLGIVKNRLLEPASRPILTNGYEPIDPTPEQRATFQRMLALQGVPDEAMVLPAQVPMLIESLVGKILRTTEARGSRLIFFTSPTLKPLDPHVKERIADYFGAKGIPYLDHSDFLGDADLRYWKDYTHLSAEGAALYSDHLREQIGRL